MVLDLNYFKTDMVNQLSSSLTEDAKKMLLIYIRDNIMPIAKDVGSKYIEQLNEDAMSENGWVKFRDAIFLPLLIEGVLWSVNTCLEKLIEKV